MQQNKKNASDTDVYQEVTNKLIQLLEKGTVPWKQLFNTSEYGFAQNYDSCIEGIEWEKPPLKKQEVWPNQRCEDLLDAMDDVPKIHFIDEEKAYYAPRLDIINMPNLQQFAEHGAQAYYRVLFHELIHWTGHSSRLARKGITQIKQRDKMIYSEEELVAELGACMLASLTGIQEENLLQNSAAYLQSWLDCMKEDKRFIFRVAPQAESAVKYILGS